MFLVAIEMLLKMVGLTWKFDENLPNSVQHLTVEFKRNDFML